MYLILAVTTIRGVYGPERVRRGPAAIKPYANTRRKKKKGGVISKEHEGKEGRRCKHIINVYEKKE